MNYFIRPAEKTDEPFLWEALYYASRLNEEPNTTLESAKSITALNIYVQDWGQSTDIGYIAIDSHSNQPIGAAWLRLLIGDNKTHSYVDDHTPELAIAVLPQFAGQGIGTQLITHLLRTAKEHFPAVVLNVRVTNPAQHLYQRMGFVTFSKAINRAGIEDLNMRLDF